MDSKVTAVAVAGLLLTIALFFFVDVYLAGIVFIILAIIVMSMLMMQDSTFHPDLQIELREDAKALILKNTGNATALKIHAALVPLNIEFDIPSLAIEATHEYQFPSMIEEVKVTVSFESEKGGKFVRTTKLNALEGPYDPLKPMIPLFKWK